MAEMIREILVVLHVSTGFVGLAAFWIPAFARKGGRLHVAAGRVFSVCAYVVALSALGSASWALLHPTSWWGRGPVSLVDIPAGEIMVIAILGFLAIVVLGSVETGLRAMTTRRRPDEFAGWRLRLVGLVQAAASLALLAFGLFHVVRTGGVFWIPVALGAAGIAGYVQDRRFLAKPRPTPMAWWYKHMEGMIGCGIGFHTAFLVFGWQRLFGSGLIEGTWWFLPWILPTAVGATALRVWTRYYQGKFGELPERTAHGAPARAAD